MSDRPGRVPIEVELPYLDAQTLGVEGDEPAPTPIRSDLPFLDPLEEGNPYYCSFAGVLTPDDNFTGRSQTTYGIGEIVHLSFTTTPPGRPASDFGGLKWKKVSGVGTVTSGTDGTGTYDAGLTPGDVVLKLESQGGPCQGTGPTYSRSVIKPSGGYMEPYGTGLLHTVNTWSCGWKGDVYLLPKNVSFTNMQFREGSCNATATGWLAPYNGLPHAAGAWRGVGNGDIE